MILVDPRLDRWRSRLVRLSLVWLAFAPGSLAAQEAPPAIPSCWDALDRPTTGQVRTQSCASASCHGQDPADAAARGGTRRQEFVLWLEHDPHAKAARTLQSAAFHRILAIVSSGTAEGPAAPQVYERCAQCHDPVGLASTPAEAADSVDRPLDRNDVRGIDCQTCHGPAEAWLAEHYRQDISRQELSALGMTDTRNLLVRARRCAACHVGDETHDMNHDMIAAGHPPLRFELSAYHDLIRHKHWSDAERIETRDLKAQLWAAGQIAVADSTLALLQSRAKRAQEQNRAEDGGQRAAWPEFAEFDCQSCHQRLRPTDSSHRQSGLAWQPWNLALVPQLLGDESSWRLRLHADPAEAWQQATALRTALRQRPLALAFSQSSGTAAPAFTADELLHIIQQPATDNGNSWAVQCHNLLALKAAYLAGRDEFHKLHLSGGSDLGSAGDDPWSQAFHQELDDLAVALRFGSRQFEWPAFDWSGLPPDLRQTQPKYAALPEIDAKIRDLAEQLRQRQEPLRANSTGSSTQP